MESSTSRYSLFCFRCKEITYHAQKVAAQGIEADIFYEILVRIDEIERLDCALFGIDEEYACLVILGIQSYNCLLAPQNSSLKSALQGRFPVTLYVIPVYKVKWINWKFASSALTFPSFIKKSNSSESFRTCSLKEAP